MQLASGVLWGLYADFPPCAACAVASGPLLSDNCVNLSDCEGAPCDDGNAATFSDMCLGGVCQGTGVQLPTPAHMLQVDLIGVACWALQLWVSPNGPPFTFRVCFWSCWTKCGADLFAGPQLQWCFLR